MPMIFYISEPSFQELNNGDSDLLGFPYDFYSMTHYGPYAFAKNKHMPTITSNVTSRFGNSKYMSKYDVLKVQAVYTCYSGKLNLLSFVEVMYSTDR